MPHIGQQPCASIDKWHINEKTLSIGERKMKSTFHELELGKAVVQNVTDTGTEQLVVTLPPENRSSVHIQVRENINDGGNAASSSISVDQHGLQKLFQWLREEGAV